MSLTNDFHGLHTPLREGEAFAHSANRGFRTPLVGTRPGHHREVAEHHHRVLDEDAVRAVVDRRHFHGLPAGLSQRIDVPVPLPYCEIRVDGNAFEVSEQAFGEAWARAADESTNGDHPRRLAAECMSPLPAGTGQPQRAAHRRFGGVLRWSLQL